jgi:glycosyltransferase involved in cell wall biosynthesis
MRVVFVNRYFYPDHSATSQMLADLAFHLAACGWDVGVITSRLRYDDGDAQRTEARPTLPKRETIKGVDVRRIWTTRFGRARLFGRALDYLTFYISALFAIRREKRSLIVAMTDPPLLSVVAALAAPNVVNWVQDLFPEVAQRLGVRVPHVVNRLRDWSLRRARVNVALGEAMAKAIGAHAVVQHNWAGEDLGPRQPAPATRPPGNPATGNRQLAEAPPHTLVVGYSGNLGRAHEFETMLAAARALPHVQFAISGAGAQLDRVRASAPGNVTFRDYVPRERLSESLSSVDVHLVTLLPALEGLVVPSKFYGVLAVARPVIFIGARDSELARLVRENDCGFAVEPGDIAALVAAIEKVAQDRSAAGEMGRRGRALYDARFAPRHAFANWERILNDAVRP